ncbi:MAG: hypothetical protein L0Z62_42230, partial [Gemmataceae bacterium]|nr:hypothetical protein [Gemmataceae bacterium]
QRPAAGAVWRSPGPACATGRARSSPRPIEVTDFDTHLGWHAQGDGRWYYGISVENGRVKDEGSLRLRTALRTLMEQFQPELRITPLQDVLLCNLQESDRAEVERILAEHGVLRPDQLSAVQRYSMACPAIPTCGLALSEAERSLPGIVDQLEVELQRLGLADEKLSVRMTGCPNGCARPYQSDIGLVGRSGDKYSVFVGGDVLGTRLNFLLRDLVPLGQIVPLLTPLLERFKNERQGAESFGDYCQRLGVERLQAMLPDLGGKPASGHSAAPTTETNGGASRLSAPAHVNGGPAPAAQPETRALTLRLAEPAVRTAQVPVATDARKEEEIVLAGLAGEERRDAAFRFNSDGRVRETVIFFYGFDARAAQAEPGDPLCREAVYLGHVDPTRLYAARKLRDLYHVGPAGHERRDRLVEYQPDGSVARTVIFYYDGDARALDAPSGSPVRRQVAYDGLVR